MFGDRRLFWLFLLLSLKLNSLSATPRFDYGKYFGVLQMDGSQTGIAVSFDAFLTRQEIYPEFNVILRTNLGGYFGSEYVAYMYPSPSYDFDKGIMQLNDSDSDLTAELQVTDTDTQIILEGPVVFKATNRKGMLRVAMEIDGASPKPNNNMLSPLHGEYRGICGKRSAALQIETGRGVGEESASGIGLSSYFITGRLGYEEEPPPDTPFKKPFFVTAFPYSSATYSLFDDKLTLTGAQSILECTRDKDSLSCQHKLPNGTQTCRLTKEAMNPTPPVQFPQLFYVSTSSAETKPLPPPRPPRSPDLVEGLKGDYYGFLHHENRDQYQRMSMNVSAQPVTINPMQPQGVVITPSVSLYFAGSWDSKISISHHFPKRPFLADNNFAIMAGDGDAFFVVNEWDQAYLKGVWYSKSYGRVGTFELVKNRKPTAASTVAFVPSFENSFHGPTDSEYPELDGLWRVGIKIPIQVAHHNEGVVHLLGQYRIRGGVTPIENFKAAYFDPNSNAYSLLVQDDPDKDQALTTGQVFTETKVSMLWPAAPIFGTSMAQYHEYTYVNDAIKFFTHLFKLEGVQ